MIVWRILAAKTSALRTKRYGESGHPCLTPLEGLNHLEKTIDYLKLLFQYLHKNANPSFNTLFTIQRI